MKSLEIKLEKNGEKTAFGKAAQSLVDFSKLAVGEQQELKHISIDVRANTLTLFMEEPRVGANREVQGGSR